MGQREVRQLPPDKKLGFEHRQFSSRLNALNLCVCCFPFIIFNQHIPVTTCGSFTCFNKVELVTAQLSPKHQALQVKNHYPWCHNTRIHLQLLPLLALHPMSTSFKFLNVKIRIFIFTLIYLLST